MNLSYDGFVDQTISFVGFSYYRMRRRGGDDRLECPVRANDAHQSVCYKLSRCAFIVTFFLFYFFHRTKLVNSFSKLLVVITIYFLFIISFFKRWQFPYLRYFNLSRMSNFQTFIYQFNFLFIG